MEELLRLGHPLGVSGTRILQTAAIELQNKIKNMHLLQCALV